MPTKRRLSAALTACLALVTAFGLEQRAQAAEGQKPATVEEIVVTGSRIKQEDLTAISPVTTVTQEAIDMTGSTRIEDLLNNLPQVAADFGGNVSNGATGAATVNLRGLGAQRTLVLINNRRLMPGDPSQNGNSTPDLNQIPEAMIQRIEVLTGGSSAVYGADAVAGVVNFVMMDNFEGVRLDIQSSGYSHNQDDGTAKAANEAAGYPVPKDVKYDGQTFDANITLGFNSEDGRSNATIYGGYRKLDPLLQAERDYSACALASGDSLSQCQGSSTTFPSRFSQVVQDTSSVLVGVETSGGQTPRGPGGALIPYDGATMAYNFAPLNYYQRPDKRYTAGVFAHLDMNDHATAYAEFQFMNDESDAQIAPSGAFRGGGGPFQNGAWAINCDNPFLNPSEISFFCTQQGVPAPTAADPHPVALVSIARRAVESGGRLSDIEHTSYRGVFGFRGDINDAWAYDVYAQYGKTDFQSTNVNDFSAARVAKSLEAVNVNGVPTCLVNADSDQTNNDPACIPWNMFQPGGLTPVGYLAVSGFQNGYNKETVGSGSVTGDLTGYGIKLPWADHGLAVVLGLEYRKEEQAINNDIENSTNDLTGLGGAVVDTSGNYDVKEVFTELRIPLVNGMRFAESASLEAGYRYSDYNLGFNTDTYKVGGDWSPTQDVRFRAEFQRAARAPNVTELFRPQVVQLDGSTDPCAVDNPGDTPAATLVQCARSGVLPAEYGNIASNPAGQYNGLTGGLPDLEPEKADTYTAGFVLTPSALPGFSFSVDYFDIKIDNVINSIGADLILNLCLQSGDPTYCGLVHRAAGGSLWLGPTGYIVDINANLGSLKTTGYDFALSSSFDLPHGFGTLRINSVATYVHELITEPIPGFPTYDCAGLYGNVCGVPIPKFRHTTRATWSTPWNFDLALTWRYSANVNEENTDNNPNFVFGDFQNSDKGIDAQNYYDAALQYEFDTRFANLTFRAGVNNILDKDPPIFGQDISVAVYVSGNAFPQAYDTMGRFMFFNATAHF